jgi:Rps23 Pro-64 3,4-dihydroxylase Tpa1-like proline 4-hydroxylase
MSNKTTDYIKIYRKVFPVLAISSIIKWCKTQNFESATVIGSKNKDDVKEKIRNAKNLALTIDHKNQTMIHWFNFLGSFFLKGIEKYRKDVGKFPPTPQRLNNIEILKYTEGGHYIYHTDHHYTYPRELSCILLLNDDYEGGELEFCDSEGNSVLKVPNESGTLIVWPSNFLFPHRVNPIKKGLRYSIVSWAS